MKNLNIVRRYPDSAFAKKVLPLTTRPWSLKILCEKKMIILALTLVAVAILVYNIADSTLKVRIVVLGYCTCVYIGTLHYASYCNNKRLNDHLTKLREGIDIPIETLCDLGAKLLHKRITRRISRLIDIFRDTTRGKQDRNTAEVKLRQIFHHAKGCGYVDPKRSYEESIKQLKEVA